MAKNPSQYFAHNADQQRLYRSIERAAMAAIDHDFDPDGVRELVEGRLRPLNRHDRAEFNMFYRQYMIF